MSKEDKLGSKLLTTEESILEHLSEADHFVIVKEFDSAKKAFTEALSAAKRLSTEGKLNPFKYLLVSARAITGYIMMNSKGDATRLMQELTFFIDQLGSPETTVPPPVKDILKKELKRAEEVAKHTDQKDLAQLASTISKKVSKLG